MYKSFVYINLTHSLNSFSVGRILNKLTPEKFDVLKGQLIESGITSADILKVDIIYHLFIVYFIKKFVTYS